MGAGRRARPGTQGGRAILPSAGFSLGGDFQREQQSQKSGARGVTWTSSLGWPFPSACLGAVATYLHLTIGTIQIWIGFIGWASFYHCGGGADGLRKSVLANLWGVIMATIALILITQVNLGLPGVLWASIVVGATACILVLGAKFEPFSVIPATVYGYASTAGYGLLSGAAITTVNLANPAICVAISLVVGGLFGIVSQRLAGMITAKS